MTTTTKNILNILWFIVVYLLVQVIATVIVGMAFLMARGSSIPEALGSLSGGFLTEPTAIIVLTAVANTTLILLFLGFRWAPMSYSYLRTRPWRALSWIALLGLFTVIPSVWMIEWIDADVPNGIEKVLRALMSDGFGYLSVGILAPIAEEILFRGAILRCLFTLFSKRMHWLPIVLSALIFGLAHGNMGQAPHAVALGLLLGWMYYRTGSIIPGIVLHWVNNSVAFAVCNLWPGSEDYKLIDLFGGNAWAMWLSLVFSMLLTIICLLQLARILKKGKRTSR